MPRTPEEQAITVMLPAALHKQLKIYAARQVISMKAAVTAILQRALIHEKG